MLNIWVAVVLFYDFCYTEKTGWEKSGGKQYDTIYHGT